MTRVWLAVADARSAASIKAVGEELTGLAFVAAPAPDPLAGLAPGDWLVVDASRGDRNGYDLAAAARARKAGRVILVLAPGEDPRGLMTRAAQATAALRLPADREQIAACLRGDATRPPLDELLSVAEERLAGQRDALAHKIVAGATGPAETADLTLFLTDPGTGLFHRSFMDMRLDEEWKRMRRFQLPLSIALVEVQGVAQPAARSLLGEVAGLLLNTCRDIDSVGRYHADRFLLLLPGTARDGCQVLLERLWQGLLELRTSGAAMADRCAIGAASFPAPGVERRSDLLLRAERALGAVRAADRLPRLRCD